MFNQIDLTLSRSYGLAVFCFAGPLIASLLLLHFSSLSLSAWLVYATTSLVIGYHCIQRYALLHHQDSICRVKLKGDRFYVTDRSGETQPAMLLDHSIVWPRFYLLKFKLFSAAHPIFFWRHFRFVFIFPYNKSLNLSEERNHLRRLRVFFHHGTQQPPP